MLITVTTTSQTLWDILSKAQKDQVLSGGTTLTPYNVEIQNLGATDIYTEGRAVATTAAGNKIVNTSGVENLRLEDLNSLNLIAITANNTNVRILIL